MNASEVRYLESDIAAERGHDTVRPPFRKTRLAKFLATLTLSAAAAGGGYAYYRYVPAANITAEAAFSDTPLNNEMSELAAIATETHMRVACDDDLLEKGGGLVSVVDGTEYKTNGRVHPLPILIGQVALPVTILREEVCTTLQNKQNLLPEVDESGPARTTKYEGPQLFANALVTLLHEKEHAVSQVFNEAAANCYAYQKLPEALKRVGMDPEIVPIVARAVTSKNVPPTQPPEYYSPECKPGGTYDLGISEYYLGAADK